MMHQPVCVCEKPLCSGIGRYFVTAIYSERVAYLLGPYATHEEALAQVARGEKLAREYDNTPYLPWYAYGTARILAPSLNPKSLFGI